MMERKLIGVSLALITGLVVWMQGQKAIQSEEVTSTDNRKNVEETNLAPARNIADVGSENSASKDEAILPSKKETDEKLIPSKDLESGTKDQPSQRKAPFKKFTLLAAYPVPKTSDKRTSELATLEAVVRAIGQQDHAFQFRPSEFAPVAGEEFHGELTGSQTYQNYDQLAAGLPVEGAGINVMIKNVNGVQTAVSTDARVAKVTDPINPSDAIGEAKALEIARQALKIGDEVEVWKNQKLVRWIQNRWMPVRDFEFVGASHGASVHLQTGEVWIENRSHAASVDGIVGGPGIRLDPTKEGSGIAKLSLPYLLVQAGARRATTDASGKFRLSATAPGSSVSATLSGLYAKVGTLDQKPLVASARNSPPQSLVLTFQSVGGNVESAVAQVNGYYHTTVARNFIVSNGLANAAFSRPLTVYVNKPSTCNANYNGSSINFFRAGSGCINTAFDTVIYHEYGHYVDDVYGGIRDDGLSEGWGDVIAVLVSQQPLVGKGLRGDLRALRRGDNAYQFPSQPGSEEVHRLGQAWAGFVWHLREELSRSLPLAQADKLTRELVLPSLVSNAFDIPACVREVLVRDDNNGNLGDGTPHQAAILAAAGRHNLKQFLLNPSFNRSADPSAGLAVALHQPVH